MTNNQSSGPEITKNKGLKSCIAWNVINEER
jgi:hypothetical protein